MQLTKTTLVTAGIAAAATLFVAATTIEGVGVYKTHSLNPLNLRVRCHFNKFVEGKDTSKMEGYEAVSSFVKANGAGTLTATKDGENWTYVYTAKAPKADKTSETTAAPATTAVAVKAEEKVVLKDWAAVRNFLDLNDIAPKTTETKPEEPENDANQGETKPEETKNDANQGEKKPAETTEEVKAEEKTETDDAATEAKSK